MYVDTCVFVCLSWRGSARARSYVIIFVSLALSLLMPASVSATVQDSLVLFPTDEKKLNLHDFVGQAITK